MLSLSEHQARWREALLSPDEDLAASLHPALPIHRNNFFHATGSALSSQFPTVEALVGDAFFVAMIRDFIVASPPASPIIMNYGGLFPDFIRTYTPAQDLPYLSDMARFEWTLHQVRHAEAAPAVEPQSFASMAPEDLLALELHLIPAAQHFSSDYAVIKIWQAHRSVPAELSGIGPIGRRGSALIVRRDADISIIELTKGEEILLQMLENGEDLGMATARALEEDRSHDVPGSIRKLASASCFRLRHSGDASA